MICAIIVSIRTAVLNGSWHPRTSASAAVRSVGMILSALFGSGGGDDCGYGLGALRRGSEDLAAVGAMSGPQDGRPGAEQGVDEILAVLVGGVGQR